MNIENNNRIEKSENSFERAEKMEQVVIDSLYEASRVHDALGIEGEQIVEKNQFGDTAVRADIECENAVLDCLGKNDIPIRVISEEHGQVDIIENPQYLGILDGLDGSNVYKKERGEGKYATMFGVFDTVDPKYKDYIVSAIMEHATKRLYIAHKGGGAFMIENGVRTPIHTSGKTELDASAKIYIDTAFDINVQTFANKLAEWKPTDAGSTAIHHADTARGAADLTLECTRKNNLEIAISHGLITEAGGAVVDMNGESLSDKKYLEFGQKEKQPIITAATQELAQKLLTFLK